MILSKNYINKILQNTFIFREILEFNKYLFSRNHKRFTIKKRQPLKELVSKKYLYAGYRIWICVVSNPKILKKSN